MGEQEEAISKSLASLILDAFSFSLQTVNCRIRSESPCIPITNTNEFKTHFSSQPSQFSRQIYSNAYRRRVGFVERQFMFIGHSVQSMANYSFLCISRRYDKTEQILCASNADHCNPISLKHYKLDGASLNYRTSYSFIRIKSYNSYSNVEKKLRKYIQTLFVH